MPFPHMSVAECTVAGLPARLFRISFTGELGFEINVPARHGLALWKAIHEAGQPYDICPYGTETMHVLRAEKGYIIVGQDTDGTITPQDAASVPSAKRQDGCGCQRRVGISTQR